MNVDGLVSGDVPPIAALYVGDTMRMSVEFVDTLRADPTTRTLVVRVREIRTEVDGCKLLILETADALPDEVIRARSVNLAPFVRKALS